MLNKLILRILLIIMLVFNYYVGYTQQNSVAFSYDTIFLEPIGKNYTKTNKVTEYQTQADMGGTTSIRSVEGDYLEWKTQGYYQRNRDIGQIFIPKKDTYVEGIVIRTGPSQSAILYNTPGAEVFIQFFEIIGTPVINDNGTPVGTNSTHGYTSNHRADDFIDSVEYKSLPVIYKGVFPNSIPYTRDAAGNPAGNIGKLYYIRWKFASPKLFEANKNYGFILGFMDINEGHGFTVANVNKAAVSDKPSLDDAHTPYAGGWCFRREGDGTLPPTMMPGSNPPNDATLRAQLKAESLHPIGEERFMRSPTSDGYPDVDTYRAFEFYIEESQLPITIASATLRPKVSMHPIPLESGEILSISSDQIIKKVEVYSIDGRFISKNQYNNNRIELTNQLTRGCYIVVTHTEDKVISKMVPVK